MSGIYGNAAGLQESIKRFYNAKNILCAGPILLPVCLNSVSVQFSLLLHSYVKYCSLLACRY